MNDTAATTQTKGPGTHRRVSPANRLGLDYRAEADRLGAPPVPIVDAHTHIHGDRAARIYKDVRDLFGVSMTYSMSGLDEAERLEEIFGETIRFIAIPRFRSENRLHAFTEGFLGDLERWHELGSRICKFWCAPRGVDMSEQAGEPGLLTLDHPWRRRHMDKAVELGMMFMVHVADPDTWFATKYSDASRYGTKRDQYGQFERVLETYPVPVIAAHMGGWPEDLGFLRGMLEKHENLYLDTSATKWMVRELSRHPRGALVEFLDEFSGRVLFGSDIVTVEEHVTPDSADDFDRTKQASSEEEAFELYASRYWALRTLWETAYEGESPIADPDLHMVDPEHHTEMDAPVLLGKSMPAKILRALYRDGAEAVLGRWWRDHA